MINYKTNDITVSLKFRLGFIFKLFCLLFILDIKCKMAGQIKLLSIKRNEEASYFYEDKLFGTVDLNKNEVAEVAENHKLSKKERKEEERKSKKEKKQKMKEMKEREKEKKKSLKNSRKEVVGSVDTSKSSYDTYIKTNGDVKFNGGFQVGMDVDETAKNNDEESSSDHEEDSKGNEESKEVHVITTREHEGASNHHEDLVNEGERVSEHELSTKTHTMSSEEHVNLEHNSENRGEETREIEETVTAVTAQSNEEAPPEILPQPKVNPYVVEPVGGEHVEIEISEVTDLEADASSSNQVIVMQEGPHQNAVVSEGEIVVATVQQVESGVDLDEIFIEVDKEEKRKSVRFQEETEEIGDGGFESKDHEHASLNLGADLTGTTDDDSVEQPQTSPEAAVEIVSQEERNKVESSVDLDQVFASAEQEIDDETALEESLDVEVVKVNGDAKSNGKAKVSYTERADFVEVSLNESNEHNNTAVKRKEKRKKGSVFRRCCFP